MDSPSPPLLLDHLYLLTSSVCCLMLLYVETVYCWTQKTLWATKHVKKEPFAAVQPPRRHRERTEELKPYRRWTQTVHLTERKEEKSLWFKSLAHQPHRLMMQSLCIYTKICKLCVKGFVLRVGEPGSWLVLCGFCVGSTFCSTLLGFLYFIHYNT